MDKIKKVVTEMKMMGFRVSEDRSAIIQPDGAQVRYLTQAGLLQAWPVTPGSPSASPFTPAGIELQFLYAHCALDGDSVIMPSTSLVVLALTDKWYVEVDGGWIDLSGRKVDEPAAPIVLTPLCVIPKLGRDVVQEAIQAYAATQLLADTIDPYRL